MGLLWGNRRKKKRRRQPSTAERRSLNAEFKRKQFLSEAFIDMMKESPELKRQMIAHEFNLKLPRADLELENELRAKIYQMTIKSLSDKPELAERIAKSNIRNMMIKEGLVTEKEAEYYSSSPLERDLATIDTYNKLKEAFGGSRGWGFLDFLKDKDVLIGLFSMARSIFGERSGDKSELIRVAKVDGIVREMTSSEYEQFKEEGRIQPLSISDLPVLGNKEQGEDITSQSDHRENPNSSSKP